MIFFLGPLPPPVHGFAAINQKMLECLGEKTEVVAFDNSPTALGSRLPLPGRLGTLSRAAGRLWQMIAFLALALVKRPDAMYVGLSGGLGQLFDAVLIGVARMSGARIYLHHHSFVYLNSPRRHNRWCFWLAGDAVHVCLCADMAQKLEAIYGIPRHRLYVLSNAAFLEDRKQATMPRKAGGHGITLGFLSNIILEKGIVEFFDVIASLSQQGYAVKGSVAGPVDPAIREQFDALMRDHPEVEYVGPVYGERKDAYLQGVDLLLFPTKYRNEAEPLTILEAMRERVPVLAADRGCIRSLVGAQAALGCPTIDHFVEHASEAIKAILTGTTSLEALSEGAYREYLRLRTLHQARLDRLLLNMTDRDQALERVQA
ncbi:glycosyltransferase family 4 protein [Noviherbaspirillum galbum]|uniref:Glycosyltransferase n=1 Tax=Noviherbaspirillum galbum TaxID=2709383 RepID=A0A6B3SPP2_9BURK|nr:glycosyltransferase [Noviherbaspirillum galbum]NEX62723.1 glycosyltransferase [Noviherbaspirillum galbum]